MNIFHFRKGTENANLLEIEAGAACFINIKTGTFGQPELFDPQLMQLIFDPGVENRISV